MRIEIDQSGKIEETHRDTILAYSNDSAYSVRITAKTKRKLQEAFRRAGKPRDYIIGVFSAVIYLLVRRKVRTLPEIVIDVEYPGHEGLVTSILRSKFEKQGVIPPPDILISSIGKRSKAHVRALQTFQKKLKADAVLPYDEIIKECIL